MAASAVAKKVRYARSEQIVRSLVAELADNRRSSCPPMIVLASDAPAQDGYAVPPLIFYHANLFCGLTFVARGPNVIATTSAGSHSGEDPQKSELR